MRSERGSITVVAAGVIAITVIATMGVADVGKALVARAHGQRAADAAALAAAQELALPTGRVPAEVAADLAARNGTALTACVCPAGSLEATVTVRADVGRLLLLPGDRTIEVMARAVVDLPGG